MSNVVLDVMQKKALVGKPLIPTIFCARFVVLATITAIILARLSLGHAAPWQTASLQQMIHTPHFSAMIALDSVLVTCSIMFYYRALQIAPLSLTIPFLTFTPAFLLITSHIVLRELLTTQQIEGVVVVIFGSMLMYRSQFKIGWLEPLRALGREPGSRYMLLAALIMSITNSLDKWLVLRTSSYDFAWLYSVGSCVLFTLVLVVRLPIERPGFLRLSWPAILIAGVADAATLALQFAALLYLRPVTVISLKRSGILIAVLAGWFFFHERQIGNRIHAATVMLAGAIMLYISLTLTHQTELFALVIALGLAGPSLFKRSQPSVQNHQA